MEEFEFFKSDKKEIKIQFNFVLKYLMYEILVCIFSIVLFIILRSILIAFSVPKCVFGIALMFVVSLMSFVLFIVERRFLNMPEAYRMSEINRKGYSVLKWKSYTSLVLGVASVIAIIVQIVKLFIGK